MSFINFEEIAEKGPQRYHETITIPPDRLDADEVEGPVEVVAELEGKRSDYPDEFLVSGVLEIKGELVCARCLDPIPLKGKSEFEVRYAPRPEAEGHHDEVEIAQGDLDVEYYAEPRIEIEDLVAEQIGLALPMKPLCREECRGLCGSCGASLNDEECACESETMDARWEALRKIRETLE
ncbi:MAG: DUF177 domain-containing protein [Acidobacteria bacterium]|nr:DUF177 domain-containing protein [Acidobacteriota bacterium]